ncbi:MAG: apolipoprotein N-acyltransferase [Elusimicrobiota bacterium]|nr:apolipoprotein N-acyltransferase [Elusimicrobiota bacterium]
MIGAAAGGALLALTFPPHGVWGLAFVGLAPLFLAANGGGVRAAALAGGAAGLGFHAVAFAWIFVTCRYAGIPAPAAAFVWGLMASFLALTWAGAAALGRWLTRDAAPALRPLVWAAAWTAVAVAGERWTPRMPADLPANFLWGCLAPLQSLSWGGPHLLGFVLVLVNAALADAWLDSREARPGPAAGPLALGLAAAGLLWAHGTWTLLDRPAPGAAAAVEVLHPDVDQYAKWDGSRAAQVWTLLDALIDRPRAATPALVVWPETSVPRWGAPEGEPVPEAVAAARRSGGAQLVGLVAHASDGPHNAAQLVAADGSLAGVYRKRELVPFGEFVPFRGLIPRWAVDRWFNVLDRFEDMGPGAKDQALLATAWGPTSVTICYEALFPRWALRDAARGARLIVNVTNDGWYRGTEQPAQHFFVNALRAVETRSWLVRSANGGLSGVISPWGEVVALQPEGARGRLDASVPTTDHWPGGSWYARHGDLAGTACLLLTLLLAALRRAATRP